MERKAIIFLLFVVSANAIYDDVYDCTKEYTPDDQASMLRFDDIDKYAFLIGGKHNIFFFNFFRSPNRLPLHMVHHAYVYDVPKDPQASG